MGFQVTDYIVFAMIMTIPFGIGLFFALYEYRKETTVDFFVGGRKMKLLPVAISLVASFQSGIIILGVPAELYLFGIEYTVGFFGYFTTHLFSAFLVVPVLFPLKLTSAFEYLEYRFESRAVRLLGTFVQIISTLWYMGVVIFGPALALAAVTNFPKYWTIGIVSVVGIVISTGGIKAVIYSDVFQAIIIFSGLIATLIKGTIDGGGATAVWSSVEQSGRLEVFDFDPDPTLRNTFWILYFGTIFHALWMVYTQGPIQLIAATETLADAKRVMLLVAPLYFLCNILAAFQGLVAYGFFDNKQCDPLESGQVKDTNQIVPFFVMDIFRSVPGMSGLFLAGLFSASLSTLSIGLSGLSAVTWQDILKPLMPKASELKATIIAKISVVVYGATACGISFLTSRIGGPLTKVHASISPGFTGPLAGLFLLGMLFPWANAKGAFTGGLISVIFVTWMCFGRNFSNAVKNEPGLQPGSTDQCPVENNTYSSTTLMHMNDTMTTWSSTPADDGPQGVDILYSLSYKWFPAVAVFVVLIVGSLVSLLTGRNKGRDVDPKYFIHFGDNLCCCLPAKIKKALNCCLPDSQSTENDIEMSAS